MMDTTNREMQVTAEQFKQLMAADLDTFVLLMKQFGHPGHPVDVFVKG